MSSTIAEIEYDKFFESIKNKSANTIRAYKAQYKKLMGLIVTPAVHQNSEKTLIAIVLEQSNPNSQQALLNAGILIRKLYDLPVEKMIKFRDRNKNTLKANVKEANKYLSNLPSLKDLEDFTDHLYDTKSYLDYAINYLLLEFNVRNADLALEIVTTKRDANDKNKNYLWLTHKKVTYFRNNYKTSDTYKAKIHTITDKKFMTAIRFLLKCQKKQDTDKTCFFPSVEQAGYVVKKATYQQLGSGSYFKIAVDTHRNDLQKIKQMGANRGTATDTIADNYDINNL